jgi:hypothetical protein
MAAHNAVLEHCVDQMFHANKTHRESKIYVVGVCIALNTKPGLGLKLCKHTLTFQNLKEVEGATQWG